MNQTIYDLILIGIAAITTFLLRALPFLLFGGKHSMPSTVQKVSESLPPAIMAVLVVYCIKYYNFLDDYDQRGNKGADKEKE